MYQPIIVDNLKSASRILCHGHATSGKYSVRRFKEIITAVNIKLLNKCNNETYCFLEFQFGRLDDHRCEQSPRHYQMLDPKCGYVEVVQLEQM